MTVDEQGPLPVLVRALVKPIDTAFGRTFCLAANTLQQINVVQGPIGKRNDVVVESAGIVYANTIPEPATVIRVAVIRQQTLGRRDQIFTLDGGGHLAQTGPVEIQFGEQIRRALRVVFDKVGRAREHRPTRITVAGIALARLTGSHCQDEGDEY